MNKANISIVINVVLVALIIVLFVRIGELESDVQRAHNLADDAYYDTTTANTGNDALNERLLEIEFELSAQERKLEEFLDCLELWSIGSGYMEKNDLYFCAI